jgi:hypothetical protein
MPLRAFTISAFIVTAVVLRCALRVTTWAGTQPPAPPVIRWSEGQPGCTFTPGDDGRLRYGLWTRDVGLIAAVDSQELEKSRKRPEPMFGVLLTIRYRGGGLLDVATGDISLEFVRHHQVVHRAYNPTDLSNRLQTGVEDLSLDIEREVRKHPEKKEQQEALLAAHQKDVVELEDFLSAHTLHAGTLNRANPEVSGWVFFSIRSAWIGAWKKPEEFLLRVPLDGDVFAIPITLPPEKGDLILRRRPAN